MAASSGRGFSTFSGGDVLGCQQLSDLVVYDIGAFHGLLTMYFARSARQVISYEPNSRNHHRLTENLRLNHLNTCWSENSESARALEWPR